MLSCLLLKSIPRCKRTAVVLKKYNFNFFGEIFLRYPCAPSWWKERALSLLFFLYSSSSWLSSVWKRAHTRKEERHIQTRYETETNIDAKSNCSSMDKQLVVADKTWMDVWLTFWAKMFGGAINNGAYCLYTNVSHTRVIFAAWVLMTCACTHTS